MTGLKRVKTIARRKENEGRGGRKKKEAARGR